MTSDPSSITYILPTTAWAPLLAIIARDARPGEVIEVHTEAMQRLAEQTLQELERQDITILLRPPRAA
jgi:hypothetical protein